MAKIFEDYFSELQADIVSICLEYVNNRANKIFIYCSFEDNVIASDFFYNINEKIVERHKVNEALDQNIGNIAYDVSGNRQSEVLHIINDDIKKMIKLCKKFEKEMPTEIRLIYDISRNKLKAEYKYDLVYSNDPVKTADDIAMEWFEQVKSQNEKET